MKEYMKISQFEFCTKYQPTTIKVSIADCNSQTVKEVNETTCYLFTMTDTKPINLTQLAFDVSCVIKNVKTFNLELDEIINHSFLLENILLALTDVNIYKKNYIEATSYTVKADEYIMSAYQQAYAKAEAYHLTRMLNHLPFSVCNSQTLSDEIENLLDDERFKITINRTKECEDLNLRGILTLSQAAKYEPAVIRIEYKNSTTPKIGLVGKGIMFDSGGYNLKSGDFSSMKTDMAGCSAVIGCLKAIANLNLETHIVAYLMTTENLINQNAVVPGDIITYRNGTSVEIGNTDAEGRLVLADGLLLAGEEQCDTIIDIATLTGNSAAALGKGFAPLYSTNHAITNLFSSLNYTSSDNIWPMPLPDEYNVFIEGNISDIRNTSTVKHAGSITAALFLKNFVPADSNWVHIDMGAMSRKEEFGTPVNGYGVRLLTNFIKLYSATK